MNPPGLIPFGVSVLVHACMNPPGLIPFGVSVLERRYIAPPEFGTDDIRCCGRLDTRPERVTISAYVGLAGGSASGVAWFRVPGGLPRRGGCATCMG